MATIVSRSWAGPDHPIYKEPLRSYSPHWARGYLKSKKNSPETSDGREPEQKGTGKKPPSTSR
jgi:hypothetical protein